MIDLKEHFDGTTNGYTWISNDDNTVTIEKYTNPTTSTTSSLSNIILTIPNTIDNKNIISIGPGAFENDTSFNSVIIPASVKTIDSNAFNGCSNLKIISFYSNSTLNNIGTAAFKNTKISMPIIPASVGVIGDGAFNTTKLISVKFLGNSPNFTSNAFNSQTLNGNASNTSDANKIYLYYFKGKTGFTNPDNTKFILYENDEMKLPKDNTVHNPVYPLIAIILVILIILFILSRFI